MFYPPGTEKYFRIVRDGAMEIRDFRVPIHMLADVTREEAQWMASGWCTAGYIRPSLHPRGPDRLGNYILSEECKAYMPNEPREMDPEDAAIYIAAAQESMRPDGSIEMTKFAKLAPREGFYRLLEADIIYKVAGNFNQKYYLVKELRP